MLSVAPGTRMPRVPVIAKGYTLFLCDDHYIPIRLKGVYDFAFLCVASGCLLVQMRVVHVCKGGGREIARKMGKVKEICSQ